MEYQGRDMRKFLLGDVEVEDIRDLLEANNIRPVAGSEGRELYVWEEQQERAREVLESQYIVVNTFYGRD